MRREQKLFIVHCQLSFDNLHLTHCHQYKVQKEYQSGAEQDGMNVVGFFFAEFDDAVENETSGYSVGDIVSKRHNYNSHKSGNCFVDIIPFNAFERFGHHDAYNN